MFQETLVGNSITVQYWLDLATFSLGKRGAILFLNLHRLHVACCWQWAKALKNKKAGLSKGTREDNGIIRFLHVIPSIFFREKWSGKAQRLNTPLPKYCSISLKHPTSSLNFPVPTEGMIEAHTLKKAYSPPTCFVCLFQASHRASLERRLKHMTEPTTNYKPFLILCSPKREHLICLLPKFQVPR